MSSTTQSNPIDPELALLIECCHRHITPAARGRITQRLNTEVDMDRLYDLARNHGLEMLLYRGLVQCDAVTPLRTRLEAEAVQQAVDYEHICPSQLAAVLRELHAAGVDTLLLKGHALGQEVYNQPALRPYSDFDILIPLTAAEKATSALTRLGYTADWSFDYPADYHLQHHHLVPYRHPEWLPVELHWRLVTPIHNIQVDLDGVWQRARPIEIEGAPTRALCTEHLLAYLALHTVDNHLFDVGLKALCDVNELLADDAPDWEAVIQTSHAWGCARQVYLLLLILREIYGTGAPDSVLEKLCPEDISLDFLAYCIANVLETAVAGLEESSGLAEAWQSAGPLRRWRMILARLFPPPTEVAAAYQMDSDDWRRWLYYPRWQAALLRRHLQTGLYLLWADPVTVERARKETVRRGLLQWIAEG